MSGWRTIAIGGLVEPAKSWNPLRADGDEIFQYIDLSAVDQASKAIVGAREVSCAEAPSRARQIVAPHDVLISTVRPNLNAVARVTAELDGATASTGFCVLRPRGSLLNGDYLFQWVKSGSFVADMVKKATGASYPAVSDRIIHESLIPLPPLTEQRRIAAILDQADALRAKRREALAQLDSLAQSIFIEMFGDPVAGAQTAALCPLESILEEPFQNGAYFPKEAYCEKGGVEMVHMSDAFGGTIVRGKLRRVSCGASDVEKYSLKTDDILIARRSITYEGAAQPCMVPRSSAPLIFESSFIRVKPDKARITPLYLFHYLNNERVRQKYVRPYVTQSTISGINQSNLAQVPVVQPTLIQQQLFGAQIAVVDQMTRTFRASLLELDTLFASLQHRAFRGEL